MRTISLEQFQGPLDLLLTLIEREKLSISEVALAQVTEQYLNALQGPAIMDPEELADFLVVAARLLVLKSRALLPMLVDEDDSETSDLERQLKIYKEYHEASKQVAALLNKRRFTYGRETAIRIETKFSPPKKLKANDLKKSLRALLLELEPIALYRSEEIIKRTVSLHHKVEYIHSLVREGGSMDFHNLLERAESRMDVIITFLALLELVKQRTIVVEQHDMFNDIAIHHHKSESP